MIVGYTYKAGLVCCDCTREVAKAGALEAGSATMWGDCGSAEEILGEWANLIGLDRSDETSFDHADFPKVVTSQAARRDHEDGADIRCGSCGWDLLTRI